MNLTKPNLRQLYLLSLSLVIIGAGISLGSYLPLTKRVPYQASEERTSNQVLINSPVSATYTYFSKTYDFHKGAHVTIKASTSDGTLSASIHGGPSNVVVSSKENVGEVNLSVEIPSDGHYTITVERDRKSSLIIFLSQAFANVNINADVTESVPVTRYMEVVSYPYKNYLTFGLVVLAIGIGVGVITIAGKNL